MKKNCNICKKEINKQTDYMSELRESEGKGRKCHDCDSITSDNGRVRYFFQCRGMDWGNDIFLSDAEMAKVIGEWESVNHGIPHHLFTVPEKFIEKNGKAQSKLEGFGYKLNDDGCWTKLSSDQLLANALRGWCESGGGIDSLSPYSNHGEQTKQVFQDYKNGKINP